MKLRKNLRTGTIWTEAVLCVHRHIAGKAIAERNLRLPSGHPVKVVSIRVRATDVLRTVLGREMREEPDLRDVVHCYGQRHDCSKVSESRKGNLCRPVHVFTTLHKVWACSPMQPTVLSHSQTMGVIALLTHAQGDQRSCLARQSGFRDIRALVQGMRVLLGLGCESHCKALWHVVQRHGKGHDEPQPQQLR